AVLEGEIAGDRGGEQAEARQPGPAQDEIAGDREPLEIEPVVDPEPVEQRVAADGGAQQADLAGSHAAPGEIGTKPRPLEIESAGETRAGEGHACRIGE